MSKSDPSDMSRINLTDDDDLIISKIRKAKTDPEPLPAALEELGQRPEARNLIGIYAALAERKPASVLDEFAGKGFGTFKPALADLTVETLRPIRSRLEDLRRHPEEIDMILAKGAAKASALAAPTLEGAYRALGLPRGLG
jgi:tryptophanyl-tRNA synthetase